MSTVETKIEVGEVAFSVAESGDSTISAEMLNVWAERFSTVDEHVNGDMARRVAKRLWPQARAVLADLLEKAGEK